MKSKLIVAALAIATLGVGMNASAELAGSGHDFISASWNVASTNGAGKACAPCHTPHSALDVTLPLWNHAVSTTATFQQYDSNTLDANVGDPSGVSLACLGCHDGSVAVDSFSGGSTLITAINGGAAQVGAGGDLTHEHPISFDYVAAQALDSGLNATNSTISAWLDGTNMECSSCHDPHNGGTGDALLHIDNSSSQLCLTCHDK